MELHVSGVPHTRRHSLSLLLPAGLASIVFGSAKQVNHDQSSGYATGVGATMTGSFEPVQAVVRVTTFLLSLFVLGITFTAPAHAQEKGQKSGSDTVGVSLRAYVDESRSSWDGKGPRPLATIVWYPAEAGSKLKAPNLGNAELQQYFVSYPLAENAVISGRQKKYPLVVLSHGNTSSAMSLDWFGYYLASNGYVVAAVNHHGNTSAEPGGPLPQGFGTQWERAKDLSVLIDKILGDPFLGPHIDADRIAAAGHSSGGATVLELAGAAFDPDQIQAFCKSNKVDDPNCDPPPMIRDLLDSFAQLSKTDAVVQASVKRSHLPYNDPRIKAVFAMAPAIGVGHTDVSLRAIQIPVYIVAGRHDDITPLATNAGRFADLIPTATLTIMPGMVGHATFGSLCTPAGLKATDWVSWVCHDEEGVNRPKVHEQTERIALSFFQNALAPK
jgi:predicted dienelactone hydrolase